MVKKHLFIKLLLLCFSDVIISQDHILLNDSSVIQAIVLEVKSDAVRIKEFYYYFGSDVLIPKHKITKITYKNGAEEFFNTNQIASDSINPISNVVSGAIESQQKNYFRYYFTDIVIAKLSFGYERIVNKKYCIEIDAIYKFGSKDNNPNEHWVTKNIYNSEGGELKIGLNKFLRSTDFFLLTHGTSVSYRQQGFSHQYLTAYNNTYPPDNGYYNITQKRKALGLFYKLNLQFDPGASGFEFFIVPGLYFTHTRNQYHWYGGVPYDKSTQTYNSDEIPRLKTWYMRDGFSFIPTINFGFDYKIKMPKKGWYKDIKTIRDYVQFKKKNILLFNLVDLIDGTTGLTYYKIFYKHGMSLMASSAFNLNNSICPLSNGLLIERNRNYKLHEKNYDYSFGLNYHFDLPQQNFLYLGIQSRMAQFEGSYRREEFTLNKYYIYGTTGLIIRSDIGLSTVFTISAGHYYNQYIKNSQLERTKSDNVVPKNPSINSFNFSIMLGYSF